MLILSKKVSRRAASFVMQIVRYVVFHLYQFVLPVKSEYWSFCCWDNHSHTIDNPRAVFEAVKDDPSITKIILQKQDKRPEIHEGINVIFIQAESVLGAYYLARSKVILLGYSLKGMSSYSKYLTDKHIIIQLWHGIPLKKIGKLFAGEKIWYDETPKYAATICSSPRDRDIMALAFSPVPRERVWMTGLPRNDFILCDEKKLPADYQSHLKMLKDSIAGKRFILYAPTWRNEAEDLYIFSKKELLALNQLLKEHNAILGIRGHANVRSHNTYFLDLPESIIYVNEIPDVNIVLRITDILITDYSSIYIDYLLTNKPIIHFAYDIDSYVNERGFLYELHDAFASEYVTSFSQLTTKLLDTLNNNGINEKMYNHSRALFHDHESDSGLQVSEKIKSLCM